MIFLVCNNHLSSLHPHGFHISYFLHHRFNVRESEIVQELTEIPAVMDDIAGFLTPEKPIELSDSANIKGVKVEEIKR